MTVVDIRKECAMKCCSFVKSSIGQKAIVAITGLFMIFFVIVHLLGNLEIYSGPDHINAYSHFLKSIPKYVWAFRIALIVAVILHIAVTIKLTIKNRTLKPQKYAVTSNRKATINSRFMMYSGLTVLVFIIYHLMHYTFGLADPSIAHFVDKEGRHHVYNMMVMGFSHPVVSGFYLLAQVLLAFHLSHGVSSAARTLGYADGPTYEIIRRLGTAFAVVVGMLYSSIPVAVMLGFLPLDV